MTLGIAESLDPTSEERYWKSHFRDEPYYESERTFEIYSPAYRLGWEHYVPGKSFEPSETVLMDIWSGEKDLLPFPLGTRTSCRQGELGPGRTMIEGLMSRKPIA